MSGIGTIKWMVLERGFGFIQRPGQPDLFFHASTIANCDFADLRQGQQVEFEVGQDRQGRVAASSIRAL
jgi:CspA family cold shock protein